MQVEKELSEICSSILSLLDDHLIPTASSGESKVFYLKVGSLSIAFVSILMLGCVRFSCHGWQGCTAGNKV